MALSTANYVAPNFRVVRNVTRPLLKMKDNQAYYIQIEEKIFQAEQVKNPKKDADGNTQKPPFVFFAKNLEDGHSVQMLANSVLHSELEKQYPDNSYVGKVFELIKNTKAEGKSYNTFGITELEAVEEEKETAETEKVTSKKK